MLSSLYLTKSRIRRQLLGVLFSSTEKRRYLSELSRLVGTSPGNVQRELARFVRDGLLECQKTGNLLFYFPNLNHALFPEIQSLVLKTSGVEGRLRDLVLKRKDITFALIYGSFANGTERGESDVDLLVVTDKETGDFYSELSKLESLFGREINTTVYSTREFKRRIREKDSFVTHILKESHRILKGHLEAYQNQAGSPGRLKAVS